MFLEDVLLGDRFWPYALFRLRFFFARYLASSAVHGVTVVLLYRLFSQAEFVAILGVYAAASLVSSFWWGALELMRGEVRLLYRSGRPHLIPREIGRWLSLSFQLGLAVAAAGAAWAFVRLALGGGIGPADAFVLVIALRLALELPVRCYHSGIYAIRRIYRPLPAILAVEVAGLAGVLALWPALGPWSFPAAAAASALLVAWLSLVYTRRTYRFFGFSPAGFVEVGALRTPARGSARELLAAGSSYAVMSLDGLLPLALFSTSGRPLDDTALFVLFFVVGPTVRAGFEWAQLLYFDLKRLEIRLFRNLRARFERQALRLALVLSLVFWALASLIGTAVYGRSLGWLYWLLLPFFVSRCLLAAVQIQAFAERAYGELLKNAAFCAAGFVAVGVLAPGEADTLVLLALVALAGFALLRLREAAVRREIRSREVLWLSEWLAEVAALAGPLRISAATFAPEPSREGRESLRAWEEEHRWRHRLFAERIGRRLGPDGGVTLIHPNRLAWFERGDAVPQLRNEWLLTQSAGLVQPLGDTGVRDGGAAALREACRLGLLGPDLEPGAFGEARGVGAEDVRRAFARLFPDGVAYAPDEPIPSALEALPSREKRIVMLDAAVFARDFRPSARRSRFDVTAFCAGGELRTIFVVDRAGSRARRARWRALVRELNLRAALAVPAGEAGAEA